MMLSIGNMRATSQLPWKLCKHPAQRNRIGPYRTFASLFGPGEDDTKKKEEENINKAQELKRLYSLYKPEKKQLAIALSAMTVSTAITMCVPAGMGRVIDIVTSPDGAAYLPTITASLAGLFVVGAGANVVRVYLTYMLGERISLSLRQRCYESILRQEMGFFDKTRTGELVNRLSADTTLIGQILSDNVASGLRSLGQAAGSIGMTFYTSPTLAATILVIIPPIAVGAVSYGGSVRKLTKAVQKELSRATELSEERLSNVRVVRWFTAERMESAKHDTLLQSALDLVRKREKARSLFFGGVDLSVKGSLLLVLGLGGNMVLEETLTIGELTSFLLYSIYVGTSFGGLSAFYSDAMKGLGASSRVFELIEREPKVIKSSDAQLLHPTSHDIQGEITFENVNFRYPARMEAGILNDFSLRIKPNETIAFVGPSGCGKSTIASLLGRFYELQEEEGNSGRILIDGMDIKHIDTECLRRLTGTVSQEPPLFATTIAENIAYGMDGDVSREDVERAARTANAHEFIMRLPHKYDTYVGERGQTLSGGQKQRIAIARALIRDPKILILDEATSALDTESETLVQEAIEKASTNRTVLLISHRLSSIMSADRIAVMSNQQVMELGTYDELRTNENSLFNQIVLSGKL